MVRNKTSPLWWITSPRMPTTGHYDKTIFEKYSLEEIAKVESFLDHGRDFLFTYAGLRQVIDKYLVQDRYWGHSTKPPSLCTSWFY